MIVNNLYETNSRVVHPDTGDTIVDEFTRSVSEIGEDKVDSYYLGWIKKDTLPSNCLCSTLAVDGEEGSRTYTWENITDDADFPCGYIGGNIEGANQFNTTVSRSLAYINQLYPEYSCEMEDINTSWSFYLYDSTGEHLLGLTNNASFNIPIKTFSKLCMGYSDASFTIDFRDESSTPAVTRHFTLTPDNLGNLMNDSDEYLEWIDEDDSEQSAHCKLRVALRGFYVSPGRRYDYRPYEPFNAQWFVKTTCTLNGEQYDHYAYSQSPDTFYPNDGSPYNGGDYAMYRYIFEFPYRDINRFANKIIQYGLHGEFTESQLQAFISSQNQYIVSNNIIGLRYNSAQILFFPLFKLKDVFKCLCLQYRTDIDITNYPNDYLQGYIPGRTYATDVTPGDEFLAKWKTGDINDPAFKESLRPWQYENFQENDFTEEDIPEPGPGPGGDDWDPDTAPDEDDNEYEKPPKTQLKQPFLGAIGQTWWAMTPFEWSQYVTNVKLILTVWDEYIASGGPQTVYNEAKIEGEARKNAYSSGFVTNPVDCVASVIWYPFDITLMLDGGNQHFHWGGTDQVIFNSIDGDGKPTTTSQDSYMISGYLSNAYWLDGGFTDYFKHYKNFIDYQPYCTAELYIPYCGSVKIDPQQYVGHHLSVRYLIDFPTGACLALIYRDDLVVDSISGQIGVTIAMSMPDYIEYGGRHMQAATNVKASKFQQLGTIWGTMGNALTGNIGGALMGAPAISAGFEMVKNAEYQLDNTLLNQKSISTATPAISTGNEQVCRLVLYQPRWLEGYDQNSYGDYGHTTGFKTIENKTLGSFSGFTVADSIDTSGISQATEKEKAMIQKAFKGGVYM